MYIEYTCVELLCNPLTLSCADLCSVPEDATVADIKSISIQLRQPPGHNYMNKCHYMIIALTKSNNDVTNVVASPGHIYYITPYTTKLPPGVGVGVKVYDAMEKSIKKCEETKNLPENLDETLERTSRRIGCSLLRSMTNFTEIGATTANLWLINEDVMFCSHEFSALNVYNAINDQLGRPTTTILRDSAHDTDSFDADVQNDINLRQQFHTFMDQDGDTTETTQISDDDIDSLFDSSSDSDEQTTDPASDYEVVSVFNSRLRDITEPCTREYHVKWGDGTTSWEPRDCFVDAMDGTICSALINFELNRTKEEHKYALVDTLLVNYSYQPSDVHTVKKHGDGFSTFTTKDNDTLRSIAELFPSDDTISPMTLLEMNVWYLSSAICDNRFHIGAPTHGLTTTSKLKRNTVLRLPFVCPNHHISKGIVDKASSSSPSVQVDFVTDYRYRNYCNRKATQLTNDEVKTICLYFAVSKFERRKGTPSDKCIEKGTAVTFTKHHPLYNTHYWHRRKIATVPLLLGPRLPSTTKLGVSGVCCCSSLTHPTHTTHAHTDTHKQ